MNEGYKIADVFQITGRGVIVVIDETTDKVPGKPISAKVETSDGKTLVSMACKEFILFRNPKPLEKEAFVLEDLHKDELVGDCLLFFVD